MPVVLDDDVLTDDGQAAVGGSLHLRLDAMDNRPPHKAGIDNPLYGTINTESES